MITNFEMGGTEHQFSILARTFNPYKFRLRVGCASHRGPFGVEFASVPEFPLGGSLYGWKSIIARRRLTHYLQKHRIQIAHAFDFYINLTLIPAARLAGTPVVIGSHRQIGDVMTKAQFLAQSIALRLCDVVVCNSRAAADRLADAGLPKKRLEVIGNALLPSSFHDTEPAFPRGGQDILRVGMVARMNAHYKNHIGFLRIAAEIRRHRPRVEFLLVGDGPLRGELERQAASLGLEGAVIFAGERRDIGAIFASIDVVVLTSNSESLSNVILEAMASRRPVVAYDVGGNAELIDNQRGVLVPRGDEMLFAAAVLRLLANWDLRNEQGHNARRFAERNFSLVHVQNQYERLYTRLLFEKRQSISVSLGEAP
jgi:L-malate glycosyltransferase